LKITLATQNVHKINEIKKLLPSYWQVLTLDELGFSKELLESGKTLESNAIQKANYVFEKTGIPVLSDDSGLEVEALLGAPGVYSARFAGKTRSDAANRLKLLNDMKVKKNRRARFCTVLAFRNKEGLKIFNGSVDGNISTVELGENGFGYDAIFKPLEGNGLTFSQMMNHEKQLLSHRSKAIRKWLNWILD